jgi:hypothetical protein
MREKICTSKNLKINKILATAAVRKYDFGWAPAGTNRITETNFRVYANLR